MVERDLRSGRQPVRDQNLLPQAHYEPCETYGAILGVEREPASWLGCRLRAGWNGLVLSKGLAGGAGLILRRHAAELEHHLLVVEDGASDQVREKSDEQEIREKVLALCLSLGEIDKVGDLGEGEKGDA